MWFTVEISTREAGPVAVPVVTQEDVVGGSLEPTSLRAAWANLVRLDLANK